ncbi:MAG: hypothetical protein HOW73_20170 [Polyangiaceae bacterium]|nr:hypothetical protein [Polyangiaceae bacterium]
MKERPIIFSGPMVRAIIEGRKTQTRRILRTDAPHVYCISAGGVALEWGPADEDGDPMDGDFRSPYGVAGDRLWVRETWALEELGKIDPIDGDRVVWKADRQAAWRVDMAERFYLASDYEPDRWRPSIHMPRWASRIDLDVASVRVERLQDITEDDARAEGLKKLTKDGGITWKFGIPDRDGLPGEDDDGQHWQEWEVDPRKAFAKLWDRINGERASWQSNPHVWVVSFARVQEGAKAA